APGRNTRGRRADKLLQFTARRRFQNALEHQQIQLFVPQGEAQVVAESVAGPIALVEYVPLALLAIAAADMLMGNGDRPANRRLNVERMREERPASQSAVGGNRLFLENFNVGLLKSCRSKNLHGGRKWPLFWLQCRKPS